MKISVLGSNGWFSTKTGNTICTLIESDNSYVVLDAGDGIYKLEQYIKKDLPVYIFLSHFHLDHISGVHAFEKIKNTTKIFGQPGTEKYLRMLVARPYTIPFEELNAKFYIHDLKEGKHNNPFLLECLYLKHADPCFGYRLEIEGKTIAYCTDTGICKNVFRLSKNVDLLISECALKPGQKDRKWPHLNPENAADIAKKSKVKKLLLTHFSGNFYKTMNDRKEAEKIARKIFPDTIAAYDGLEIEL